MLIGTMSARYAAIAGVTGTPSRRRTQMHSRPGPGSGWSWTVGWRISIDSPKPSLPWATSDGGGSMPRARATPTIGFDHSSESAGPSTTGWRSNTPVRPPGFGRPVAPSEAKTVSPVGEVAVTRTCDVRPPWASTSVSTSTSLPLPTVETNWVVTHSGVRSVASSAVAIDTAMAVPP